MCSEYYELASGMVRRHAEQKRHAAKNKAATVEKEVRIA
jgi:hypothetical protein